MYTLAGNPDAEAVIAEDMNCLVRALREDAIPYEAVYLAGGFGRGEGTVRFDGGRWYAVNDFDLVLMVDDKEPPMERIGKLAKRLAERLNIDFVDIGCIPCGSLSALPPSLFNYELKYGSLHIDGQHLLDSIPNYSVTDVPAFEFLQLLCNRCAGLNMMVQKRCPDSKYFESNQLVKAAIAVGDIAVFLAGQYSHLYRVRMERFRDLFAGVKTPFPLSSEAQRIILHAYQYKLNGPSDEEFRIDQSHLKQAIMAGFVAITNKCVGVGAETFAEAERLLWDRYRLHRNLLRWAKTKVAKLEAPAIAPHTRVVLRVLFSQPWFYLNHDASVALCAWEFFRRFWGVPSLLLSRRWNAQTVLRLWEHQFHAQGD